MMFRRICIVLLAALSAVAAARAEPLAEARTEYVDAALYAERAGLAPGETTWFALRQNVRDGWHVFWVNPGDAGLPLELAWSLPDDFEIGDIDHPAPHYIPVGPLASYAHEGAPVFLIPVTAPADAPVGDTVNIEVDASWQACEDICVPEDASFRFTLPILDPDNAPADENGPLFADARAAQPELSDAAARFRRAGDAFELVIDDWTGAAPKDAFFFVEEQGLTTPAAAQTARIENGALVVSMQPGWIDGPSTNSVPGVLSFKADESETALTIEAAASVGAAPAAAAPSARNLPALLALAFFGGLILNAMPCVFPILFVKAATLMQAASHEPHIARRHGALYGVGVVASFLAIGVVLAALRAGGEQLGWGFHLQSPLIVGLSAYVLFAVGLNLAGVFSVGEGLAGVGDAATRQGGDLGAFFTGVLAVAVAAPCIGPLLTAPMGAALTLPVGFSILIFLMMALGLAAPFVAVAFWPRLGRVLPKPGPWMAVFKQALSFPVFAAGAYFLWVFARQTGDGALAGALAGLVLLALAAWLFEHSKGEGARALVVRAASALALAIAVAPLLSARPAEAGGIERYGALAVEAFDETAIADYRAEGRPVFAIFTAAWCVTCQADKLTVFSSEELRDAIEARNGVVMVADWTLRDAEITAALAQLGAVGVPFYAYYGADGVTAPMAPPISKRAVLEKFTAEQGRDLMAAEGRDR